MACQVRVASKVGPQWPEVLVTVLTIVTIGVPSMSVADGGSKVQGVPSSTILLVLLQLIVGTVVSTTLTLWLQRLKLPQASVAVKVTVAAPVAPQSVDNP